MVDRTAQSVERREEFEAMYRRCEEPVLGYALRRAPIELAQDAVAEVFVAAWRRFEELPPDPLPWLIGATRKALANQRRSSARQSRLVERIATDLTDDGFNDATEQGDPGLRRALQQMSVADREALALVAWDGLTPTQAARSIGCSPVAFRVRLHRARRRLERALQHEDDEARRLAVDPVEMAVKEAS